jgi:hypothetical protein
MQNIPLPSTTPPPVSKIGKGVNAALVTPFKLKSSPNKGLFTETVSKEEIETLENKIRVLEN